MDAGLSHPAEGSSSQLFVEDGTPIKFYVDPGSVFSRPKLIRNLKSAGASIASDPKTADFILVQSNATTGQHFIRDWSNEKKVLEATWVSKTMAAGRLLKESDRWGDCLAIEDPSVGAEDLEQNHLPTPRITPVEAPPNTWPSNGGPLQPPTYPAPDSRHSSQQPSVMNGHLVPPILPNQIPQYPQQPGGQQPVYYHPPPQQFPSGLNIHPDVYSMVLVDIMKNQGLLPWAGPPQGPGMQNGRQNGMQNGMQPGFFAPPGINPMQYPQMYSQPPGLIPAHDRSASPLSVSDPLPPSPSRRSSAELKGKGKATPYVPRSVSGSSRTLVSSSTSDKIFISNAGEPLTFYVAIEVHNRSLTLNHIKKNGGQISTQTTADFAILSSRSKDFEILLETVMSSNGTAVKPAFVLDSVEQHALLDPSRYEFELPPKLRKVQKAGPSSPRKADAEKRQAINSRKAKSRKAKKDVAVKEERNSPGLSRIPSPSPPPEHTRVLLNGIKYRYPEVENAYVRRYAAVLFERDQDTSFTAMAAKLHAKMPHHSAPAWVQHISHTLRDDVEDARKRARIAHRKEEHHRQVNADEPPAKRAKSSNSEDDGGRGAGADPGPGAETVNVDVQHDLNAIAHFFANGGDAEQEGDEEQSAKDARTWARLTEQTPCRTEANWVDFYNNNHDRVMQLYHLLSDAQDESPAE
ncbi:hypothetical protein DFH09DRAFT_1123204 [Mycena vulgaris]|nr:hypothetical protein DFH09DRAFT_1123204 [Mycena vulgaris]